MKTKQTERKLSMGERYADIMAEDRAPAQAQHSPLPWRRAGGMVDGYAVIASDNHAVISQKLPSYNATFIVRACNNAERLADALKGMMGAFCRNVEQTVANEGENALQSDVKRAREALAQWEGSKQ